MPKPPRQPLIKHGLTWRQRRRSTGRAQGQAAMLSGRLSYLQAQRDKLAEWEAAE